MVSVLRELQKQEENKNHLEEHKSNESTETYLGLKASVCGLLSKSWVGFNL